MGEVTRDAGKGKHHFQKRESLHFYSENEGARLTIRGEEERRMVQRFSMKRKARLRMVARKHYNFTRERRRCGGGRRRRVH